MPTLTHDLPTGALGTGELPVPPIPGAGLIQSPGALGSNLSRGGVVFGHGLNDPNSTFDVPSAFFTALVADGWIVYHAPFQEDAGVGVLAGSAAVFGDLSNDATFGLRYLTSWLHTWDHIVNWIRRTYGFVPIVSAGYSWGAWRTLWTVQQRPNDMVAYVGHCPIQFLTDANPANTPGGNWSTLTTSGADLSNTCLNAVNIPGLVGWSNPDTLASSFTIKTPCDAAIAASKPVTEYATTTGHGWPTAASTEVLGYFTATIDPLCPKVF